MRFFAVVGVVLLFALSHVAVTAGAEFGDRPAGYEAAERAVAHEGRKIAELVRAGDADGLHARFDPALAEAVPLSTLRETLGQTLAVAPVGARTGESLLPLGAGLRTYGAEHRWGDDVLGLRVAFDDQGTIVSARFLPRVPLPRDPAGKRKVRLQLPLEGRWWVFWGGDDELRNYHVVAADQRHAIDFLRWERGGTAKGAGVRNRDYHAWGARVVAPADGVVVKVRDGVPDNLPRVEVANEDDPAGNHVILKLGHRAFALLGHLRDGSVKVRPGDRVRTGDLLGKVGNSGNSSEPHLHFHVQDDPRASRRIGLPVRFRDIVVDGKERREAPVLQGQFIS